MCVRRSVCKSVLTAHRSSETNIHFPCLCRAVCEWVGVWAICLTAFSSSDNKLLWHVALFHSLPETHFRLQLPLYHWVSPSSFVCWANLLFADFVGMFICLFFPLPNYTFATTGIAYWHMGFSFLAEKMPVFADVQMCLCLLLYNISFVWNVLHFNLNSSAVEEKHVGIQLIAPCKYCFIQKLKTDE